MTSTRPRHMFQALALAGVCSLHGASSAQTITVDIADADIIDVNPDTATVADLPGPDGHISFSEAMIASNNTPGRQTVGFAIPTSEWTYLPWYYTGRAVVTGMMFYANAYDEVTIDGTTQTAFTGDTNPDGREVVILRGGGLYVSADNCAVAGLDSTAIYCDRSNCTFENNSLIGLDIYGGEGGAGSLVRNNTGGGNLKIDQSNNNIVVGNTFQRVRVLGWITGGRPATNNRIGGPTPAERNSITGLGTLNSQGIPGGFAVQLFHAIGTIIENNQIGTTPDGLSQGHPYTTAGVYFDTENYDTIIRNNRIAGIRAIAVPPHAPSYPVGTAIQIHGEGSGVTITGNKIGLNANDEPVLGSVTGISTVHFFYPIGIQNVVIGGSSPGEGNEIAGHLDTGVSIANTYSGARISGNSIHDNGGLGIDLVTDAFVYGVTPNDPGDGDIGGNGLQNFPVITAALGDGVSQSRIEGTLNSNPNQSFTIECFANPGCDASGQSEGARFLGSVVVTTDASGNAGFVAVLPASAQAGESATATATRVGTGDTSEFSACTAFTALAPPCVGDADGDGNVNFSDITAILSDFGGRGAAGMRGDADHNGEVNFKDITTVLANWNTTCP